MIIDKQLPNNIEIENSLLSSFILFPDSFDDTVELNKEDFYDKNNSNIFHAIKILRNKKQPIDIGLIADYLKNKGENFREISKKLLYLSDNSEVSLNAYDYSSKVKDYSNARSLILSCSKILDMAYSSNNMHQLIEFAQSKIMSFDPAGTVDIFKDMEELMSESINRIEQAQIGRGGDCIDFGFNALKNKMQIQGSKLIFIAGRPGMGKTAMMIALAKHISYQDIKTGILTIEMDNQEISDRIIASESDTNSLSFYIPGKLNRLEVEKVNNAANNLSVLPIVFNDSKATIKDVIRRCRKMKKDGCKIIFIDQLSKISFDRRLSEYEGYTRNCGILAELKKELRIPIVVLCQLGRKVEESADKKPNLSHLKQTGQIEEDADMVFFIYRPGYYKLKNNAGLKYDESFTEIILAKCRNGITGNDFSCHFNQKRGYFDLGGSINHENI